MVMQNLCMFLPWRFSEAEIRGEAIYVFLNLLSHYHDGILGRSV